MCFGCQCPDPLPPPSPVIQKCRLTLQILAIFMLIISVLNFVYAGAFQGIISLLFIYFLYLAWTTFNTCATLFFFILCVFESVSYLISIIGLALDNSFIQSSGSDMVKAVLVIFFFAFYFVGIFIVHYIYRLFKSLQEDNNILGGGNLMPPMIGQQMPIQDDDSNYQAPQSRPPNNEISNNNIRNNNIPNNSNNVRNIRQPNNNVNPNFAAFAGQGVRIG